LGQLRASLHDSQAKRDDLGLQEEADHVGVVHLHQGSDDAQGGESEVLVALGLGHRVQERVEKQRDVSIKEQLPRFLVRCHTLQQGQYIAGLVGDPLVQVGLVDEGVNRDDLL